MRLTGVILDIYDDPKATVLLQKLAGRPLPEELGNSDLLGPGDLARLPDHLFGLVATNGDSTLRKFATHDPAHTVTSVMYFLETRNLLPAEVQKVAASNLLIACEEYGIAAPEQLQKVAILGAVGAALDVMSLPNQVRDSVSKGRATMDGFRAAQAGATADMQHNKQADLTGTEMMPVIGPVSTYPHSKATIRSGSASATSKRASWERAGDLTVHHPAQKVEVKVASYAMPSVRKYPLDSYADVKTAAVYFDEHYPSFDLEDRREYAVHLADRMEQLGMAAPESVAKYAGHEYGPFVDVELMARARNYEGTEHQGAYEVLLEKRAAVAPFVLLETLAELDSLSGADTKYDAPLGFRDPFQAVYGKFASEKEPWAWTQGNEYVNDTMLKDLATNRYQSLDRAFGMDMRKSFQQDPVGVFTSMPDPQKVVIARLAADDSKG